MASRADLHFEIRGAKELEAAFRKSEQKFPEAAKPGMEKALYMLRTEMKRLVPVDRMVASGTIRSYVEAGSPTIGHVGPGATTGWPMYILPLEGGRRVDARVPPFGINSKLYGWVQRRTGGGIQDARFIAMAIARRGLPTKNNPQTPNEPPVFVERALWNKHQQVRDEFDRLGGDYVTSVMTGWRNPV